MSSVTFRQYHERSYGRLHPLRMQVGESNADILSEGRGFMQAFDFTMQLQVGCPGGCGFCFANNPFLAPASVRGPHGENWGFRVNRKRNAVQLLARHLEKGTLADKTLYASGITDIFATPPEETRAVWQALRETPPQQRPRRVVVQSRFRVDRDVGAMAAYAETTAPSDGGPAIAVSLSVGTDREDLIAAWEKSTPRFAQRLRTIRKLRENGLFVVATLSPFGLWNDLPGTMSRLRDLGVAYVTILFFKEGTRWANTPRPFLEMLRAEHPQLLDPRWQEERAAEVRQVFGEGRVLVGQPGFASLAAPQNVRAAALCLDPLT